LEVAITSDPPPDSAKAGFGKRVAAWIQSMIGKAASGGWKIGIGAAGKLLEEALLQHYGLK
jgi:hypothetical protein